MTDDAARASYPDDVYPESGSRLPPVNRDALDDEAQAIFDQLNDPNGRSLVGPRGPGGVRLHSPKTAILSQPLNAYLRWESGIAPAIRETAILITAREHDCQFEWAAHEPAARKEGVSEEVIEAIKHRRPLEGLPETEAAVIQLGREVWGEHRVTPETFARALAIFGARDLVDLVSLMGIYSGTAAILLAFDNQLLPGQAPLLPVP